jgi:hypothetical protein
MRFNSTTHRTALFVAVLLAVVALGVGVVGSAVAEETQSSAPTSAEAFIGANPTDASVNDSSHVVTLTVGNDSTVAGKTLGNPGDQLGVGYNASGAINESNPVLAGNVVERIDTNGTVEQLTGVDETALSEDADGNLVIDLNSTDSLGPIEPGDRIRFVVTQVNNSALASQTDVAVTVDDASVGSTAATFALELGAHSEAITVSGGAGPAAWDSFQQAIENGVAGADNATVTLPNRTINEVDRQPTTAADGLLNAQIGTANNLTVQGESETMVVSSAAGQTRFILWNDQNADGITIDNVGFDGDDELAGPAAHLAVALQQTADSTVTDSRFGTFSTAALSAEGGDLAITNNVINNPQGGGIAVVVNDTKTATISGNDIDIDGSVLPVPDIFVPDGAPPLDDLPVENGGIGVLGAGSAVIADNTIDGASTNDSIGIGALGGLDVDVQGGSVQNTTLGVAAQTTGQFLNVTGVTVTDSETGIAVDGTPTVLEVTSNDVVGTGSSTGLAVAGVGAGAALVQNQLTGHAVGLAFGAENESASYGIHLNVISDNEVGVDINTSGGFAGAVPITFNNIQNNAVGANVASGDEANLRANYWGTAYGPGGPIAGNSVAVDGDIVAADRTAPAVSYTPALGSLVPVPPGDEWLLVADSRQPFAVDDTSGQVDPVDNATVGVVFLPDATSPDLTDPANFPEIQTANASLASAVAIDNAGAQGTLEFDELLRVNVSSEVAGPVELEANETAFAANKTVTQTFSEQPAALDVTANPGSIAAADGRATVTATLLDADGDPINQTGSLATWSTSGPATDVVRDGATYGGDARLSLGASSPDGEITVTAEIAGLQDSTTINTQGVQRPPDAPETVIAANPVTETATDAAHVVTLTADENSSIVGESLGGAGDELEVAYDSSAAVDNATVLAGAVERINSSGVTDQLTGLSASAQDGDVVVDLDGSGTIANVQPGDKLRVVLTGIDNSELPSYAGVNVTVRTDTASTTGVFGLDLGAHSGAVTVEGGAGPAAWDSFQQAIESGVGNADNATVTLPNRTLNEVDRQPTTAADGLLNAEMGTANNLTIQGESETTVVSSAAGQTRFILWNRQNADGLTIDNVGFDGDDELAGPAAHLAVALQQTADSTVTDSRFGTFSTAAISAEGGNLTITNNTIDNAAGGGIAAIINDTKTATISNNEIDVEGSVLPVPDIFVPDGLPPLSDLPVENGGIGVIGSGEAVIADNTVDGASTNDSVGIGVLGGLDAAVTNNAVQNTTFGVAAQTSGASLTVTGTEVTDSGLGIGITGPADSITATENVLVGQENSTGLLLSEGGQQATVTNNELRNHSVGLDFGSENENTDYRIHFNDIRNNEVGVSVNTTGGFAGAVPVTFNDIVANDVAVAVNSSDEANLLANYWGTEVGPGGPIDGNTVTVGGDAVRSDRASSAVSYAPVLSAEVATLSDGPDPLPTDQWILLDDTQNPFTVGDSATQADAANNASVAVAYVPAETTPDLDDPANYPDLEVANSSLSDRVAIDNAGARGSLAANELLRVNVSSEVAGGVELVAPNAEFPRADGGTELVASERVTQTFSQQAAALTFALDTPTIYANGTDRAVVTATVRDANGDRINRTGANFGWATDGPTVDELRDSATDRGRARLSLAADAAEQITVEGGVIGTTLDNQTTINAVPRIDVLGDGNVARDTTGDGLLNDVRGEGDFNILDIQSLFNNLGNSDVQNNASFFDFSSASAPGVVSELDVQALFERLEAQDS